MTTRTDRKAVILHSEVKLLKKALSRPDLPLVFAREVLNRLDATFKAYEPKMVQRAFDEYHRDGEIEIDDGATCSRGEDDGCYVQAWVWVYDKKKGSKHG